MHALILAGGEGSRLRADGVTTPKPFLELAGRPLLLRLVDTLGRLGCETITAVLRDTLLDPTLTARLADAPLPLRVVRCATPSSLHSLSQGLERVPPGPVLCSMVDTVMREQDWRQVFAQGDRCLTTGADACVAVTPFVADERPLYVLRHAGGGVAAFQNDPVRPALVTGGVYFLSSRVRSLAPRVLAQGIARMRGFLRWLVEHGYNVETAEVERIVDLDRGSDLLAAAAWLGAGAVP